MKQSPPARAEALELMSHNPNLIKRPIVIKGGTVYNSADLYGALGIRP